jgi:hypothetical protein
MRLREHEINGIKYRALNGMIRSIKTPKGWFNVFQKGTPSKAVCALIDGKTPEEVYEIIYEYGNKI